MRFEGENTIKENTFVKYEKADFKQIEESGCNYCTIEFGNDGCCSDKGCCAQK